MKLYWYFNHYGAEIKKKSVLIGELLCTGICVLYFINFQPTFSL